MDHRVGGASAPETHPAWGRVGVLILVLAAVVAPVVFLTTLERFAGGSEGTLLGDRVALWKAAWLLIVDHPWKGVGIGNGPMH